MQLENWHLTSISQLYSNSNVSFFSQLKISSLITSIFSQMQCLVLQLRCAIIAFDEYTQCKVYCMKYIGRFH
uniref:Uncharacterized protein n=1 Tax=Anguilla anguilla TaxID=7936 RepID=A0A0E9WWJ4_ANGAN